MEYYMISDNYHIILKCCSRICIEEYDDPYELVYETRGNIELMNDSDEEIDTIGKFKLYYVDVSRSINRGEDIFEVMDAHSSSVAECFYPIFDKESQEFNENIMKLFSYDVLDINLLIIDRLEILPEYRGEKIGLKAMRQLIHRFSLGAGIVAIKPFPLQFESTSSHDSEWVNKMQHYKFPINEKECLIKLKNYYAKLGFVALKNSKLMVLNTAKRLVNGL